MMFTDHFLEFLNLYLVLLDVVFVALMAYFIYRQNDWKRPSSKLAIGLMTYVFGSGIVRGWTWIWRYVQAEHISVPFTFPTDPLAAAQLPVFPIGLIITTLGMVCIVRQFYGTVSLWFSWIVVGSALLIAIGITWGWAGILAGLLVVLMLIVIVFIAGFEHPPS
jgi:hypothetical protein